MTQQEMKTADAVDDARTALKHANHWLAVAHRNRRFSELAVAVTGTSATGLLEGAMAAIGEADRAICAWTKFGRGWHLPEGPLAQAIDRRLSKIMQLQGWVGVAEENCKAMSMTQDAETLAALAIAASAALEVARDRARTFGGD